MPKVHQADQGGGGRRGRGSRVSATLSEINVVPLVDVMLVLLVIFMVTAPMMQQALDVNLPEARRAPAVAEQRITIVVPLAYRSSRIVRLDNETIRIDVLQERMRQAMQNRTDREVFLAGDGGLLLQELLEVMDRLKEGGVERVGLLSRPPESASR
jgi:biopolymer transport protein ExbD